MQWLSVSAAAAVLNKSESAAKRLIYKLQKDKPTSVKKDGGRLYVLAAELTPATERTNERATSERPANERTNGERTTERPANDYNFGVRFGMCFIDICFIINLGLFYSVFIPVFSRLITVFCLLSLCY
jgi:hypothetical protein